MPYISVKVNGVLVRKGLQNLAAAIPQIGRQQIRTVINRIVRRMQAYPPEPPHRFKTRQHATLGTIITRTGRTGLLGRSWAIEEIKSGYKISNFAARKGRPYAKYVVGDALGKSRNPHPSFKPWPMFRTVVAEEIKVLPAAIGAGISRAARKEGL